MIYEFMEESLSDKLSGDNAIADIETDVYDDLEMGFNPYMRGYDYDCCINR